LESVAQTVAQLLAKDHDVRVITTTCGSNGAPLSETRGDVRVRRFAGFRFANTPISLGLALQLLTIGRRPIVHVHIAHAFVPEIVCLTSLLRRGRYVAHYHTDVDSSGPFGVLLGSYKRWILGPCLRRAAAVITLSQQQANFVVSRYHVRRERISVIPNGVDPAFYALRTECTQSHADSRPMRLLNVSRLDHGKGHLRLIDAMAHVSANVELVIVGDGTLRNSIAERIKQLGLTNTRLVGPARGAELLRWYEWADAFVLPSDGEGMPLVVLEAMAAGLAVVATDVQGTRDVVSGAGLLTGLDAESLGVAIEQVANDPELLAELSASCAARGIDFRWDSAVAELERIYDAVSIE
jgi:phosphatidylinositol alpha-mannosyltransferase